MADHGMRYGDWFTKADGGHELKLPLFFLITSNDVL